MDTSTIEFMAKELGFCDVGFCSPASFEIQRMQVMAQPMLSERRQLSFDPACSNTDAKSIAVLLWPYVQSDEPTSRSVFIDNYYPASNAAYHAATELENRIRLSGHYARANVSYPAKAAAVRAGLGIIGDHSLLIHPVYGTRVVVILLETDLPISDHDIADQGECLHCGKCHRICPTGAIAQDGMSHPERCLRNFMMEGVIVPDEFRASMGRKMLGCDLCQRVCPMQPERRKQNQGEAWRADDFLTNDSAAFSRSVKHLADIVGRNIARHNAFVRKWP